MPDQATAGFEPSLGCLIDPALAGLAAQLQAVPGLSPAEAKAICAGTGAFLTSVTLRKITRVLLLELNAARVTGRLHAADPASRWDEWLAGTLEPGFWEALAGPYPTMLPRLSTSLENGCAAALIMASRFAADRAELSRLPGACRDGEPGELTEVSFGAGDSHNRGQTVAMLRTTAGRVVYKPRPVDVDARLAALLRVVTAPDEPAHRIRVPEVVVRDGYGWAEHVGHQYCDGDGELAAFYRGLGHWLALMRLVGGSDLHAENVIAAGPVPVVVDCETLFTPHPPEAESGYGHAFDHASQLIADSPLRTGLLPGRGDALAWRGVDSSAIGQLPGQQPYIEMPVIVGVGTDEARIGYERQQLTLADNHPSKEPALARFWPRVLAGFTEMGDRLGELDSCGALHEPLRAFADCTVRVVVRPTETYMELSRMLWHPVSLHDEHAATERAAELMAGHAANVSVAPADRGVIDAEIAELLDGDVPLFATTPRTGRLHGPRGSSCGAALDLVQDALHRWRARDHDLDIQVISGTLISAYLNEGVLPSFRPLIATNVSADRLDERRRRNAAGIMRIIRDAAIRADDGTVTWIAPIISPIGWATQPLSNDFYNGISGIAVALAGYQLEVSRDRADPVDGIGQLLTDSLTTLTMIEDKDQRELHGALEIRPDIPGGYVGLGGLICAWLLLARLGVVTEAEGTAHALISAEQIAASAEQDDAIDLFRGMSGAIVPLLRLTERSGDPQWAKLACEIGIRLGDLARTDDAGRTWWSTIMYPEGMGGTAHGVTGVGWALARLSASQEAQRDPAAAAAFGKAAAAAFGYEESLYDSAAGGWSDLREPGHVGAAWCHGSVGIGIVAADLAQLAVPPAAAWAGRDRWLDVLRRAAACSWVRGLGANHTLCHGDLGVWEIVDLAFKAGLEPAGLERTTMEATVVSGLTEYGPTSGLARDTLTPGLLPGIGGMAYQLLRMDPRSTLPSVLLPDPGPATAL